MGRGLLREARQSFLGDPSPPPTRGPSNQVEISPSGTRIHVAGSARSWIRTRLWAAAVKTNTHPTSLRPRRRILRIKPTVLIHP